MLRLVFSGDLGRLANKIPRPIKVGDGKRDNFLKSVSNVNEAKDTFLISIQPVFQGIISFKIDQNYPFLLFIWMFFFICC